MMQHLSVVLSGIAHVCVIVGVQNQGADAGAQPGAEGPQPGAGGPSGGSGDDNVVDAEFTDTDKK